VPIFYLTWVTFIDTTHGLVFRLSLVRSLLFDRLGLFRFLRHRSKFSRRSLFAFSIGHILIIFNYYYFYPEEWSSILGKCIILQSRCFVLRNFFEKIFFQIPSTVDRLSRSLKATQRVESATRQQSIGNPVIRFQLMRSLSDLELTSQTVRAGEIFDGLMRPLSDKERASQIVRAGEKTWTFFHISEDTVSLSINRIKDSQSLVVSSFPSPRIYTHRL